MRYLMLLRHGEAENYLTSKGGDHGRKLTPYGHSQLMALGQSLVKEEWTPDLVISSDATRAQETWQTLSESMDISLEPLLTRSIYTGDLEDVYNMLYPLDDKVRHILMVGHNPTWSHLASSLSGSPLSMSTADAVLLRTKMGSWDNFNPELAWEIVRYFK